eukprot:231501-Pyramimonas_sp.AAC.2
MISVGNEISGYVSNKCKRSALAPVCTKRTYLTQTRVGDEGRVSKLTHGLGRNGFACACSPDCACNQ